MPYRCGALGEAGAFLRYFKDPPDTRQPPADLSQIQPQPANRDAETVKAETAKLVADRGLTNDGRRGGRTLTSVAVEPDGTVHVQC